MWQVSSPDNRTMNPDPDAGCPNRVGEAVPEGKAGRSSAIDSAVSPKVSRLLWGVDWAECLPRAVTRDGIELHVSSIELAMLFIAEHYTEIFEQDLASDRFFSEPFEGAKLRYYQASDVFEMKDAGRTVGLLIGAPSDWSTYYIRSMAVLPAFSGRQLPQTVLPFLFGHLSQAGVRRFEAEASPSNFATMLVLTRMHFNVTGMILSERWGALCRLTKFADERAEGVFLEKFCSGIRYQQRHRGGNKTEQRGGTR
jgi:ribosomal protein S18 acetylase RimI-like enzyme